MGQSRNSRMAESEVTIERTYRRKTSVNASLVACYVFGMEHPIPLTSVCSYEALCTRKMRSTKQAREVAHKLDNRCM